MLVVRDIGIKNAAVAMVLVLTVWVEAVRAGVIVPVEANIPVFRGWLPGWGS